MKLYLVRHAQRGWGKNYDALNHLGRIQTKRIAPYFKDKKITFIYCSENERAIQTLNYIKKFINKKVPTIITKEIRQHNVPEEVGKDAIKEFDLKQETETQLQNRVKKFLEKIKRENKKDNVLIISHKEVIKIMICKIMERPFKEAEYISKLPSASISYFEFDSRNKLKKALIGNLTPLLEL
jgi:broad specificity phosphatase PhoE